MFVAGEDGYAAFRIPGIAALRLPSDASKYAVLAFAEGRKFGCGDFDGQHDVVMKRREYSAHGANDARPTTVGEKTSGAPAAFAPTTPWSNLTVLLDPLALFGAKACPPAQAKTSEASCEFWDPTPVVDRVHGVVFLLATRSWNHSGLSNQQSRMQGRMDLWVLNSTDAGSTWSAPRNITATVYDAAWGGVGTPANGHGIQLTQGAHAGRLVMPIYLRNGTDSGTRSAVIVSDDYGNSWSFLATSAVGPGTSESDVVELQRAPANAGGGGRPLMFNHRPPAGRHVRFVSRSDDDGATFVNFTQAPAALVDPGCKGGIAAWRAARALLFANDDSATAVSCILCTVTFHANLAHSFDSLPLTYLTMLARRRNAPSLARRRRDVGGEEAADLRGGRLCGRRRDGGQR